MGGKLQKFKKILSGAAASMMMFGAAPKSNTKAMRHSSSSSVDISVKTKNDVVATCVAGVALTGLAIGVGVAFHLENKAWKEELSRREGLISNAHNYISNLAISLKEIIPRSNSDLFSSLVNCQNYVDLRNWQTRVYNCNDLSSITLDKIINCLHNHWRTDLEHHGYYVNDAAHYADMEVGQLRNKYNRLVNDERWKEHMKLEKEKLDVQRRKIESIEPKFMPYPPNAGVRGGNNIVINNYGNNYYSLPVYY